MEAKKSILTKMFSQPDIPFKELPREVAEEWKEPSLWQPLQPKKNRMFFQKLDSRDFSAYRFKPGFQVYIGQIIFVAVFLYFFTQVEAVREMDLEKMPFLVVVGFGLGLIFNIFKFGQAMTPVIFDQPSGFFWKGWQKPWNGKLGNKARLRDIEALQIIHKQVSGKRGSAYVYELNLLLKNKDRLNVIDHSEFDSIKTDAISLARFLRVPLWNGVSFKSPDPPFWK